TIPNQTLHTINGIVINKATRQPVKGARVSIKNENAVTSLFSAISEGGSQNQTDEQGRWSYKELPPGKYTVTVQPPYSYESPEEKNKQKVKTPKLAQLRKEIVVEEKDLTDLVLELGYGTTISGTISFDNQQILPSSITITAVDENGKFAESSNLYTQYTNDGKPIQAKIQDFKIEGIPNGKVFIKTDIRAYGEDDKQAFYVKSILYNGRDVSSSPLETKEGEEIKGVQIILSNDVGKLKGKVTRTDKTAVSGAKIFLLPTDKTKWANYNASLYAATNSDGEFEVSGAPGEYFVVLQKDSDYLNEEETEKSLPEQRRELFEKQTLNASKATIKAKETETIALILPE
ncbi:MAG: carboxypeptidase-like regulatory domain-containing protein, partial [Pyrinomonadaceae bacterium]|nr:carboxypeptidase-like regulatory domain-containing protein [Pyrinomonadaceae bacterium]